MAHILIKLTSVGLTCRVLDQLSFATPLIALKLSKVYVLIDGDLVSEPLAHVILPAALVNANDMLECDGVFLDRTERLFEVYSDAVAILQSSRRTDLSDVEASCEVVSEAILRLWEVHSAEHGMLVHAKLTLPQTRINALSETLL